MTVAEPRAPGPPPEDALEWFRAKGLKIGFDWRDVWREEHAAAFTVAKIMRLDLLADVRAEVDRALAEGLTFRDFQKRLAPMLQEKGWWGVQDMADPQTGEVRQVQLGSPRRLRVIYDTNLRTARAAGQWARIQKTREGLPYLLYTVGPSREHRPEHLSWHGTLLPVDDPWWKTHFVPNGWGCKCRIRQVSRREYERLKESGVPAPPSAATQDIDPKTGLPTGRRARATVPVKTTAPKLSAVEWTNRRTGEVMEVPRGIDPGWDYNPGEGRLSHLQKLLADRERGQNKTAPRKATVDLQALQNELEALYRQCEIKKPEFDRLVARFAEQTGGEPVLVPLKSRERALEKTVTALGGRIAGLTDILRATLLFETKDAAVAAFDSLRAQVRLLRERNLYRGDLSVSDGYRDAKIDFDFDGIPVELQFNTRKMLAAKVKAHALYEEKRKLLADKRSGAQLSGEQKRRLRDVDRLMRALYQEADDV